jgi:ComEC/Rec2-related protein
MGGFRAGLRDGGGASPTVSLAAGRGGHGGRPLSLRRSRTFALAYRARGRVARRSRISRPREPDRVFFPLRALRGFCGRTVGGPADGAGRGAGPRQDQDRYAPRLYRGDGLSPQRRALPFAGSFCRRACSGTNTVQGPAVDAPGAAFRGRHLCEPKGQASPPPARASLPGGYDFARDAWFARLGAVGNVLGRIEVVPAPESPGLAASAMMAIDRGRNALARGIDKIVGGDSGAIAAAMVTGKRDLLSDEAKEVIREAGIFHIITISGVQMTLVAAIFFVGLRRLLALSQTLALSYPIKKWAALFAIAGALFYDIATGSRVGTERALFMTLIMLTSVVLDRQALTMRNLAIAAALVILIQPEAIMGASFQLSFAAVVALVAVYEARMAACGRDEPLRQASRPVDGERKRMALETLKPLLRRGPLGLLFATFCATSVTASFMAYNFHELSPYVLIGNPLTLTIIEIFAVPGALLGTLLYPLGLDAFVWRYVGLGIDGVMWAARGIGSWPGSTIHLPHSRHGRLFFSASRCSLPDRSDLNSLKCLE